MLLYLLQKNILEDYSSASTIYEKICEEFSALKKTTFEKIDKYFEPSVDDVSIVLDEYIAASPVQEDELIENVS